MWFCYMIFIMVNISVNKGSHIGNSIFKLQYATEPFYPLGVNHEY
jgi:hypothetical protein